MKERKSYRQLQEELKILKRIVAIAAIVIAGMLVICAVNDYAGNKHWNSEIETMAKSSSWHRVDDGPEAREIVRTLKEQTAINGKLDARYVVLNEENTFGLALFWGPFESRTVVTFDYDEENGIAKVRFLAL